MNSLFAKRALALAAAAALLFSLGCGQASAEEKATEDTSPEIVAVDGGTSDTATTGGEANASYAGIYHVDATTDESESGSYASSTANENTVLVESAGKLTMSSADINKTGDAEDGFSGQNYFPDGMARQTFYRPVERGFERDIGKRVEYWNKLREKKNRE